MVARKIIDKGKNLAAKLLRSIKKNLWNVILAVVSIVVTVCLGLTANALSEAAVQLAKINQPTKYEIIPSEHDGKEVISINTLEGASPKIGLMCVDVDTKGQIYLADYLVLQDSVAKSENLDFETKKITLLNTGSQFGINFTVKWFTAKGDEGQEDVRYQYCLFFVAKDTGKTDLWIAIREDVEDGLRNPASNMQVYGHEFLGYEKSKKYMYAKDAYQFCKRLLLDYDL